MTTTDFQKGFKYGEMFVDKVLILFFYIFSKHLKDKTVNKFE